MRSRSAPAFMTAAMAAIGLNGLSPPSFHPVPGLGEGALTGPMDPSVDGDLSQVDDHKPGPATSDRVAPGPSECAEQAAPEVRHTPAGGQTGGKRARAEQDKRRE